MSDAYKKAYEREKQSRLEAEKILEKKSREIQSNIEMITLQFDDLMKQKNESDYLLSVARLARSDSDLSEIIGSYLSATMWYLGALYGRYTYINNKKLIYSEMYGVDSDVPKYGNDDYKKIYIEGIRKVIDVNDLEFDNKSLGFSNEEIDRVIFIPIKRFGRVATVCEIFIEKNKSFDYSLLDQCEISGYQIGNILESLANRKKIEKSYLEVKESHGRLKQAQSQLVQSEKMASLGLLAAGVAHEINNPIGFVMSNVDTLKEYMGPMSKYISLSKELIEGDDSDVAIEMKLIDDEENFDFIMKDIYEIVSDCSDGLIRIKDITANLKSFSRVDDKEKVKFDVNSCIDNVIKVVWNELKYKVDLVKKFSDSLPLISGHEGQVGQVVMNILTNAAHAINEHGEICIQTKTIGESVMISISDTGSGIPMNIQERIFDPFFTTKDVDEGTGLGLSVSYGIIDNHGGNIKLSSKIGEGSTFEICLPIE